MTARGAPPRASLWSFGGGPGSWSYRVFDAMRTRLDLRLAGWLRRRLAGGGPFRTLEAGSGPGSCSSQLAGMAGVRATVLDWDPEPLGLARRRDPGLAAVRGDLYALPFPDGAFDLVFSSSTMEHLDDFGQALAEMARVTRPAGLVFVGVPYRWGPFLPFNALPDRHPVAAWMGRLYSRAALRRVCATAGLREETTHLYFFGCFVGLLLVRERRTRTA